MLTPRFQLVLEKILPLGVASLWNDQIKKIEKAYEENVGRIRLDIKKTNFISWMLT